MQSASNEISVKLQKEVFKKFKEILDLINSDPESNGWDETYYYSVERALFCNDFSTDGINLFNDWKIECVDSYGGEGQGETYYTIYKVTNPSGNYCFVKFYGSYYSYDGAHYDRYFQVIGKTVQVIQYSEI